MKIDKNELCPCGSGKKYKDCCGNVVAIGQFHQQRVSSHLILELIEFAKENYDEVVNDGWVRFWDGFDYGSLDEDVYEMGLQNYFDWVVYDLVVGKDTDEDGNENELTLIEDFILKNGSLSEEERTVLSILDSSPVSLYEVRSVEPDKGIYLRDLLLGGEIYVHETIAPNYLNRWDIIATRLLYLDDIYIMSGAGYIMQRNLKQEIIDSLNVQLESSKLEQGHVQSGSPHREPEAIRKDKMRRLLKRNGWMFNKWWLYPFESTRELTVVNADGESAVLAIATYKISDIEEALRKIDSNNEFEADGDGYLWLGQPQFPGEKRVMGGLALDDGVLKFTTNSKERLDAGKKLIEYTLGSIAVHRIDTFQDIEKIDLSREMAPFSQDVNPAAVQQTYEKLMNMHYEQWLNDDIPILRNKTPLEAAGDHNLRPILIDLVKDIENAEDKNRAQGRPSFDPSWIKERLEIKPEEF
jgi:hypothetical protein